MAERFPQVDVAVLFAGAARTPLLGDANLTLDGNSAAEAARILAARYVVLVHVDGWRHFTEGSEQLRRAFSTSGLEDRLVPLQPGDNAHLALRISAERCMGAALAPVGRRARGEVFAKIRPATSMVEVRS